MSDTTTAVPDGFEQLPPGLGFNDVLQPCYRRVTAEQISFGLVVQEQHCNTLGICHGGVLLTLADMAAANGANHAGGRVAGSPTLNLSVDFITAAKPGQWLQADVDHAAGKRRFGFASGVITGPRGVVARFNATVYFPDHDGLLQEGNKLHKFLALQEGGGEG